MIARARPDAARSAALVLADLLDRLDDGAGPAVCLHGDATVRNAIANDGRVALLDLEHAAAGPAGADLGKLLAGLTADCVIGRISADEARAFADALRGRLRDGRARPAAAGPALARQRLAARARGAVGDQPRAAGGPAPPDRTAGGREGMKPVLLFYCQHSVGLGHLMRSYALCRALSERFRVVLVTGGQPPAGIEPPHEVEVVALPPLGVGADGRFESHDRRFSVERAWAARREQILAAFERARPGRRARRAVPVRPREVRARARAAARRRTRARRRDRLQPARHPRQPPQQPAGARRARLHARQRVLRRRARALGPELRAARGHVRRAPPPRRTRALHGLRGRRRRRRAHPRRARRRLGRRRSRGRPVAADRRGGPADAGTADEDRRRAVLRRVGVARAGGHGSRTASSSFARSPTSAPSCAAPPRRSASAATTPRSTSSARACRRWSCRTPRRRRTSSAAAPAGWRAAAPCGCSSPTGSTPRRWQRRSRRC